MPLRACQDKRAGQGDEVWGLRQVLGITGFEEWRGERLESRGSKLATGCGHGARPPCMPPPLSLHGEGRKLLIPGPWLGGGGRGNGVWGWVGARQ